MINHDDLSSKCNTQKGPKVADFAATLKQILDSIPKLACVIVAVWDYFHTRDMQRFFFLLALGYTANCSLPKLKVLAPKMVALARVVVELLDKVK